MNGLSLIIPCLNEERCIAPSVRWALKVFATHELQGEIIVVDNGSTDRTAEIARQLGVQVVHANRPGYGEALRAGFQSARFKFVAMVDADLSYPLDALPLMLKKAEAGADLVLGNRLFGQIERGAMPHLNRYLGTPVLSWMIRRLHRLPTYDSNSGLRVIRRESLIAMNLQSSGMEIASEMLIRASHISLRYAEVPIDFRRDQRGSPSHLRRWHDGYRHLKLIGTMARSQLSDDNR